MRLSILENGSESYHDGRYRKKEITEKTKTRSKRTLRTFPLKSDFMGKSLLRRVQ